jgi:hypothetical protein
LLDQFGIITFWWLRLVISIEQYRICSKVIRKTMVTELMSILLLWSKRVTVQNAGINKPPFALKAN